jgi:tetratricopeptide (TPR) repeat protein
MLITSSSYHSLIDVMATTNATAPTTNATAPTTNATAPTKAQLVSEVAKLNKQGNDLLTSGKYNESIAAFDKALASNPNYFFALIGKGFALVKLGKYNESIPYLDKALSINPKNVNALNLKTFAQSKTVSPPTTNNTGNISKGVKEAPSKTVSPPTTNNPNILRIIIP